MKQYRLIGYPLGHSMSPAVHRRLFSLEGIEADYTLCAFPPEELETNLPALRTLSGFNITIPHKCSIIPHLDALDDLAQLYGAVNTVCNRGGRLVGYNTDCDGFLRTMAAHSVDLQTSVCVLGAGGAGRMLAIECARRGARVTVAVRESGQDKAVALAAEIREKCGADIAVQDIATLDGTFELLLNATPVGMFPHADACPVTRTVIENTQVVFDCIYNPAETMLLRHARELGKQAVGGMDMLVWQAVAAHEIWNHTGFSNAAVSGIIEEMNRILLQGESHQ